jgi:glycosyltransferase involved in cell wall biosynthesis
LSDPLKGHSHRLLTPFLSIIIPAYNEENRLPKTLEQVYAFLGSQVYSSEVIVADNASQDSTFDLAMRFAQQLPAGSPNLQVIQEPTRGKGAAVRKGMWAAKGVYRFMCDADLSMPITEVNRFLPPFLSDYDIAIASREAPGAIRFNEPGHRHLVGRVFNTQIRFFALPELQDTQCGFKCFRAAVAEDLFQYQTITGWSFDVELLFIARQRGYRILEVPIPWYFNSESKVSVVRDSFQMGIDIFKIRLNGLRGMYDNKPV